MCYMWLQYEKEWKVQRGRKQDCFCCCEKIERNKEERCQTDWKIPSTAGPDLSILFPSLLIKRIFRRTFWFDEKVPRQKELSKTKKQEKAFKMKILKGKKTCWRHMPLNSAILPRRWLKENKFINNSSNVIFTSDEYFCQNKNIKNLDILHLLSSFAWSNRLLSVFNSVFSLSDVSCCCLKCEREEIIILWQGTLFMKKVREAVKKLCFFRNNS